MNVIFDNAADVIRADDRIILEEDDNGLLYETTNANTRALVCSAMFPDLPAGWIVELETLFSSQAVAERYYAAATDSDK